MVNKPFSCKMNFEKKKITKKNKQKEKELFTTIFVEVQPVKQRPRLHIAMGCSSLLSRFKQIERPESF